VRSAYVKGADEAIRFSNGKPIVMKVISQEALHKSKSGLVKLNLSKSEEIRSAFSSLMKTVRFLKLHSYKVLVQEMVPGNGSVEIIIGGKVDPQFGKLVLLGLGGIYVEVFKDVAVRVCPINRHDAEDMLYQLKSHSIIASVPKSEDTVISLLLKVSRMLTENDIHELDLNPVILHPNGYNVVDPRILE
jgi:succinyl-CoA synthetase beta subunit